VRCARRASRPCTKTAQNGVSLHLQRLAPGSAPQWATGLCDDNCQEYISAHMAHISTTGRPRAVFIVRRTTTSLGPERRLSEPRKVRFLRNLFVPGVATAATATTCTFYCTVKLLRRRHGPRPHRGRQPGWRPYKNPYLAAPYATTRAAYGFDVCTAAAIRTAARCSRLAAAGTTSSPLTARRHGLHHHQAATANSLTATISRYFRHRVRLLRQRNVTNKTTVAVPPGRVVVHTGRRRITSMVRLGGRHCGGLVTPSRAAASLPWACRRTARASSATALCTRARRFRRS